MKKRETAKKLLCLCLALSMISSLAACKGKGNGEASAPPTASAQPTAKPTQALPTPELPFTDVSERAYYYEAVKWALEKGIASGTSDTQFEPDSTCTRGQVITFIWRAMGSPKSQLTANPLSDVSSFDGCYEAALWAYESGISSSTAFKPDSPCTNGEALAFLWRAVGEPIAIEDSSFVARAFPGTYFTQAVAWAENNGLFSEMKTLFDPTAPCPRGDMVMFLYWATEQWSFTEEEKTVQAEYKYILNNAVPFAAYADCLCFAEYIDAEGDGRIELLTLEVSGWSERDDRTVTAAIYGNVGGHAGKTCEQTFFTYRGDDFSLYRRDGQLYLCQNVFSGLSGETYDFYRIEANAITFCEQATVSWRGGTSEQDEAILQRYTDQRSLLILSSDDVPSVVDRGIAPGWSWEEQGAYMAEHEEYWTEYWTNRWASEPMYAAVLNGDFSAFAGTYSNSFGNDGFVLDRNGAIIGDSSGYATNQRPVSINVTQGGVIRCVLIPEGVEWGYDEDYGDWSIWHGDAYDICPIGTEGEPIAGYCDDTFGVNQVRILYTHWGGSAGASTTQYGKVS